MIPQSLRAAATAALLGSTLLLSACDSAEERADSHYQSGVELLEAGDVDRAVVEFRNVFDLNPRHREARIAFAEILLKRGDLGGAFSQYQNLAEFYPSDPDARAWLTRISLQTGNWPAAERHGDRLAQLDPDAEITKIYLATKSYRAAIEAEDAPARREAAQEAQLIQAAGDDDRLIAQITIDNYIRDGEFGAALDEVDRLLGESPKDEALQQLKLRLLGQLRDESGIEEQLRTLVEVFPGNDEYQAALLRWYTSQGNLDAAEAFIRGKAAAAEDKREDLSLLVAFLNQARGPEAALAELDAIIADGSVDPALFRSLRAGILYDMGNRDEAIAQMEGVLENAESTDETRNIKVALAQMLQGVGNEVAARQIVEEILSEDSGNVGAIKMRAAWLIREDKADEAIVTLRTALDQAPGDPQIMTLMSDAHLRNGNRGLAGEMLALAVEASQGAPKQSLDYARFLMADENYQTAETILIDSLRRTPGNRDLLAMLGQVYVRTEDWARVEQVEGTLRRLEDDASVGVADALRVARLRGQQRGEEAIAYLEELANREGAGNAADIAIARTYFQNREFDQAESFINSKLAENPSDSVMRMLLATVYQATDRLAEAQSIYRELLSEDGKREPVWRALFQNRLIAGEPGEAEAIVEEALAVLPDAPNLLWIKAGFVERSGDIEGAIAIYEGLYERLPNSPIIANNLASLIATYDEDDSRLDRAYNIARRLKGTEVPAFQDTYGWIAYRRGQIDEALEHLEPAAERLKNDPIVQFHYGMALSAAKRYDAAIDQLRNALSVAGPADTRVQFDIARQEIERIEPLLEEKDRN